MRSAAPTRRCRGPERARGSTTATTRQRGARETRKRARSGVRTHYLSPRLPTTVPNTMDDPKPAMKRRPMSPLSKPYAAYSA